MTRILIAITLGTGLLSAQAFDKASPDKKAEEVFQNIKVLNGDPSTSMRGAMEYFNSALGVTCENCHDLQAFDKDQKNMKKTAREMITMTREINKNAFKGEQRVNCFTCHQGHQQPVNVAATPMPVLPPPPPMTRFRQGQGPKAEDIVAKYQAALGGADKLAQVHSFIVKGSETAADGKTAAVEVRVGAPDKVFAEKRSSDRVVTEVLNGKNAWGKASAGTYYDSDELAPLLAHEGEAYPGARVLSAGLNLRVIGTTKIGDREVLIVFPAQRGGTGDRLFFDKENGLLLRQSYVAATAFGPLPTQIDYEDYRAVQGVQYPFRVKYSRPTATWTRTVGSVQPNAEVKDSSFEAPK